MHKILFHVSLGSSCQICIEWSVFFHCLLQILFNNLSAWTKQEEFVNFMRIVCSLPASWRRANSRTTGWTLSARSLSGKPAHYKLWRPIWDTFVGSCSSSNNHHTECSWRKIAQILQELQTSFGLGFATIDNLVNCCTTGLFCSIISKKKILTI